MNTPSVLLLAARLGLCCCCAFARQGPAFTWDTLPIFFHGSNASGPVNPGALALMARFPLVTVEKFQGPCGWRPDASPACDQESQIIDVLKGVKAINPNVSTIFCTYACADQPHPPPESLSVCLLAPSLILVYLPAPSLFTCACLEKS
jgi:hypothetical protein